MTWRNTKCHINQSRQGVITMKFVPARCTQCGAELSVDPSTEAAVCVYCNTPFIVEKAINNYITNLNIANATFNVGSTVDLQSYKTLAYEALGKQKYDVANKYFKQLYEANHDDYISKFHIDVLPVIEDKQSLSYIVNTALLYCPKALSQNQINNTHYSFYERFNIITIAIESIVNKLEDYDELLTCASEIARLTETLKIHSAQNPNVRNFLCDISDIILPKLGIAFERLKSPAGKKAIRLEKKERIQQFAEYYNQFRQGKNLPEQFYKSNTWIIVWNYIGKYLLGAFVLFILCCIFESFILFFASIACLLKGIYVCFTE